MNRHVAHRWRVVLAGSLLVGVGLGAARAAVEVPAEVLAAERARIDAIRRGCAAAVAIFVGESGGGSGVIVSRDGYALTNFHVIQAAGPAVRCGLADGTLVDAVVVGLDPTGDVALVKLVGRAEFPAAELADSDGVRPGDWCFTAGNPFLLATDLVPSASAGIVSGVHRYQFPAGTILEYTDCLQVDAAINPGNSGGGLFDAAGRLIGVNGRASFEKRGRVNVGAGYAISSNQLRNFMGCLRAGRLCDHATLGATVSTSADGRVVVGDILEDSDAWRRGLRCDDEIVALAGRPVRTVNAFKNVLGTLPAGWQVPLAYRRSGMRHELLVRLAGVHSAGGLAALVAGHADDPGGPDRPGRADGSRPAPRLPGPVAGLYEPRSGFANHHFAVVERDRIAAAIARRHGGLDEGKFAVAGSLEEGGGFRLVVGADAASLELPTGDSTVDLSRDLDAQPLPPGSGGLLPALALWRRLVAAGPAALGRTIAWGKAPVDPDGFSDAGPVPTVDVLESAVAGVEARFFVDATGTVVGVDFWAQPDAEPCEVRFAGFAADDPVAVPTRIVVRRGGQSFATLSVGGPEPTP